MAKLLHLRLDSLVRPNLQKGGAILLLMLTGDHPHRRREEWGLLKVRHVREVHLRQRLTECPQGAVVRARGKLLQREVPSHQHTLSMVISAAKPFCVIGIEQFDLLHLLIWFIILNNLVCIE